jgi:hypothetical protein
MGPNACPASERGRIHDRQTLVWHRCFRDVIALDDAKPIELIARGEYRRVAKLISEIEYPGVS